MAGPIAIAAALSRLVKITCPLCSHQMTVDRRRAVKSHRVCQNCHKQFPDPLKPKTKRK